MSQLKEQVLSLQKQLQKKDQELLEKDKKVSMFEIRKAILNNYE